MTFLIERLPDGVGSRKDRRYHREALLKSFPFEVEVEVEPRGNYASPCDCKSVYRIVDVEWLKRRELLRRGMTSNPCVCACMGRAVEARVAA